MKGVAGKAYLAVLLLTFSSIGLGLGGFVGSVEAQINPFNEVDDILEDGDTDGDGECDGTTDGANPVENQTSNATGFLTNSDDDCGINDEGDGNPSPTDCDQETFNASECADHQVDNAPGDESVTDTINSTNEPVDVTKTLNDTVIAILCEFSPEIVDILNDSISVGCPEEEPILPEGGEVVFTNSTGQTGAGFEVNVTEGDTDTFTVHLTEQPIGVVNVTFEAGDYTALSTTGNVEDETDEIFFLFGPTEVDSVVNAYSDPQTVFVHGLEDDADDQNETDSISWEVSEDLAGTGTTADTTPVDDQYDGDQGTLSVTVIDDDHRPVLTAIGNKTVAVDQLLEFTVTATDPDTGDTPTFSLDSNTTGATLDSSSDAFSWTPTTDDIGWHYANISVTDAGGLTDWENITITVNERTTSLESNFTSSDFAPLAVRFWANVTDPALVLSDLSDSSVNATFDDGQGTVTDLGDFVNQTRLVTYNSPGSYTAYFNGTHDTEGDFSHSIDIEVLNNPPVLDAIGNESVLIGQDVNLTFSASDLDGDGLTFDYTTNATGATGANLTSSGNNAWFNWTAPSNPGTFWANFTVDDGTDLVWDNVTITVADPSTSLAAVTATSDDAPLTVEFWVNSTSNWTTSISDAKFDSGNGSTVQQPNSNTTFTVEYDAPGSYMAWLNVSYTNGDTFNHSVPIEVLTGAPATVELTPDSPSIAAGGYVNFSALARDAAGFENSTITAFNFTIDGVANGTIDKWGNYSSTATGVDTINVSINGTVHSGFGGIFAITTVTVAPGAAAEVVFTQNPASTFLGNNVTFVAHAEDAHDNTNATTVAFSIDDWDPSVGSIDNATGEFEPAGVGTATINATADAVFNTTTVTVNPLSTSFVNTTAATGLAPLAVSFDVNSTSVWSGNITGATFDSGNGSVKVGVSGNSSFTVTYSAGSYTAWFNGTHGTEGVFNHSIPVTVSNNPPVVENTADQTIEEGHQLVFWVNATDSDGDVLSLVLDTNASTPYGFNEDFSDPGYGNVSFVWTPDYQSNGTYYANFTFSDPFGGSASENVTIIVSESTATNTPPQITVEGNQSIFAGHTFDIGVIGTDADDDGGNLTLGVVTNATSSEWSLADDLDGTGNFTWTTADADIGWYYANFSVTDINGSVAHENVTLTVSEAPVNDAPILESIGDNSTIPGKELAFTVTATDANGDTLTFSLDSNATGAAVDPSSGAFSWTPSTSDIGWYYANFSVDDGNGGVVHENITLTVREPATSFTSNTTLGVAPLTVNFTLNATGVATGATFDNGMGGDFDFATPTNQSIDVTYTTKGTYTAWFNGTHDLDGVFNHSIVITVPNSPPVFVESITDKTIDEGEPLLLRVNATDADAGDTLNYTVTTNVTGGGSFDDNSTGGKDFTWTPGSDDNGTYFANFTVSDGELEIPKNITITVERVNDAPVLATIDDQSVEAEETLLFDVTASDPDGDGLTFGLDTNATSATLDSASGAFSWTPPANSAGTYFANISVTDGELTDFQNVTITVTEPVLAAPVLDEIGDRFVEVEDTLSFRVNASDADGNSLTFDSESGLDTNVTGYSYEANTTLGGMDFSWTPTTSQTGTYFANFTVTGGDGLSDFERITITVRPSIAPVLSAIPDFSVEAERPFKMALEVTDPGDEDGLEFDMETDAPGASLHPSTGRFTMSPKEGDEGTYFANFIVTDDDGLSDSQNVTITVTPYVPDSIELDSGAIQRASTNAERQSLIDAGLGIDSDEEVLFVDLDGDGDHDAVETASGTIETAHDVDSLDVLVLVDTETDAMAVMDFGTGGASPVLEVDEDDTVVEAQKLKRGDEEEKVSVTVPKEDGWIYVVIDDPAPDQNITSLERSGSDDVTLELDQAWRTSDGRLHLIDDPDTTYTFGFEPVDSTSKVWLWILLSVLGVLVLAGAGFGVVHWLRGREERSTGRADRADQEDPAMDDESFDPAFESDESDRGTSA